MFLGEEFTDPLFAKQILGQLNPVYFTQITCGGLDVNSENVYNTETWNPYVKGDKFTRAENWICRLEKQTLRIARKNIFTSQQPTKIYFSIHRLILTNLSPSQMIYLLLKTSRKKAN